VEELEDVDASVKGSGQRPDRGIALHYLVKVVILGDGPHELGEGG
jgi:hypothetical protein